MIKVQTNIGVSTSKSEEIEQFTFPGGEVQIKLPPFDYTPHSKIEAIIKNSDDVMALLLTTSALRNKSAIIDLTIKYFPYARQDRVCNEGEAFSMEVFANLINTQKYNSVTVWDIHNEDMLVLIDRVRHVPQSTFTDLLVTDYDTIVLPDSGALKKLEKLNLDMSDYVIGYKVRDTMTGQITQTKIEHSKPIKGKDLLIIDDIADGGRTFIELAKVLKKEDPASIRLYVTHGIFSKGLDVFDGLIDKLYTTNSFCQLEDDRLEYINIED